MEDLLIPCVLRPAGLTTKEWRSDEASSLIVPLGGRRTQAAAG